MLVIDPPLDRYTFTFTPSQMSRGGGRTLGLMSKGGRVEGGVPCDVTYSMMYLMLPALSPWTACENITFLQLSLRAVTMLQTRVNNSQH